MWEWLQGRHRRSDICQLYIIGFAVLFPAVVLGLAVVAAVAQSQDAINATLIERIAAMDGRLTKLETYVTAGIVATVGNLIAHLVSIKTQRGGRRG